MNRLGLPLWKKLLVLMLELAAIAGTIWVIIWMMDMMGLV